MTIIAFTGGAAPLVTFDGPDIGRGLMVMIIGFPIVGTIVYWVGMAVTLVTASVVGGLADLVVRD